MIIKRTEEIAEKRNWTMTQVSLAWISRRVTSPIVGISSVERLDEAVDIAGKVLTTEEEEYLEEPYQVLPIDGHA